MKGQTAANSTLELPCAQVGDFKHCFSQYFFSTWQDDRTGVVANKLYFVKPLLGDRQSSYRRYRKDDVVLCCTRIGHTNLTHSYILRNF